MEEWLDVDDWSDSLLPTAADIDSFSKALNTLHEDITVFVNSIAHIVHYYVESNFGSFDAVSRLFRYP